VDPVENGEDVRTRLDMLPADPAGELTGCGKLCEGTFIGAVPPSDKRFPHIEQGPEHSCEKGADVDIAITAAVISH
jgi:hypothetical protein